MSEEAEDLRKDVERGTGIQIDVPKPFYADSNWVGTVLTDPAQAFRDAGENISDGLGITALAEGIGGVSNAGKGQAPDTAPYWENLRRQISTNAEIDPDTKQTLLNDLALEQQRKVPYLNVQGRLKEYLESTDAKSIPYKIYKQIKLIQDMPGIRQTFFTSNASKKMAEPGLITPRSEQLLTGGGR